MALRDILGIQAACVAKAFTYDQLEELKKHLLERGALNEDYISVKEKYKKEGKSCPCAGCQALPKDHPMHHVLLLELHHYDQEERELKHSDLFGGKNPSQLTLAELMVQYKKMIPVCAEYHKTEDQSKMKTSFRACALVDSVFTMVFCIWMQQELLNICQLQNERDHSIISQI